jgi:hypothetical protein
MRISISFLVVIFLIFSFFSTFINIIMEKIALVLGFVPFSLVSTTWLLLMLILFLGRKWDFESGEAGMVFGRDYMNF